MKNETGIHPIRAYILVRLVPEGMTEGGIALPDGVRLKNRAQVIAVGRGHVTESGARIPLDVEPGDFIITVIPPGAPVVEKHPELGDLLLIREEMVLAVDKRNEQVTDAVKRVVLQ